MKLVCPSCGCYGSADVFIFEAETLQTIRLALSVPEALAGPMVGYLRLFAPAKRALSARRVKSLLSDLLPMIEAGRIERKGRTWPAPVAYWRAAMEEVATRRDTLRLPLSGHGYLLEILAGLADKAEGTAERAREAQRAYPFSQQRQPTTTPQAIGDVLKPQKTPPPAEVAAALKKFSAKRKDA